MSIRRVLSAAVVVALWGLSVPTDGHAQWLLRSRCGTCNSCTSGCEASCGAPGCAAPADPMQVPPDQPPPMIDPGQQQAPVINQSIAGSFGAASGPSAAVPGMLGDSYITTTGVSYTLAGGDTFRALVPYGGRYKCADNTGPVPTNRVSFVYKHFHNALQAESVDLNGARTGFSNGSIDSYTLGIERTILDDWASLEVRIPFYGGSVEENSLAPSILSSPSFGNLSFILKVLWSRSDYFALGGGLGVDVPTAEDSTGLALGIGQVSYDQDAVYLAPFIAFLGTPNDNWWYQGVVQFSFATGSNGLFMPAAGGGPAVDINARFREQDLVFLTFNAGAWLTRSGDGRGVAAIAELNYTATLEETELVSVTDGPGNNATLTNFANHQNVLALTTGLHFQVTPRSNFRVAAVVPLKDGNSVDPLARDRFFDAEVSVQFNRNW